MKSSTIRRSALSKESMDVIENLANEEDNYSYSQQSDYQQDSASCDNLPNEYVRTSDNKNAESKSQEIDLLWQSFKSAQFNSNSPFMHVLGGFFAGVVTTLIVLALFGVFAVNHEGQKSVEKSQTAIEESIDEPTEVIDEQAPAEEQKVSEDAKSDLAEPSKPVKTKKYIIKDGDTVEAIIKHEYGAYTPERAEAIMKANNLSNLDHISIDQELLLPVEK